MNEFEVESIPTPVNPDMNEAFDRLREWLLATGAEAAQLPVTSEESSPEVGLLRLIEEFTALRHEVKLQTRSGRQVQEQAEAALTGWNAAAAEFRSALTDLHSSAAQFDEAAQSFAPEPSSKAIIEAVADLDDALERGSQELSRMNREAIAHRDRWMAELEAADVALPWWGRSASADYRRRVEEIFRRAIEPPPALASFAEGYLLIRARLQRIMDREGLALIDSRPGTAIDPHVMRVVDTVHDSRFPAGTVAAELRRGYRWNDSVLRVAEVRACKGGE